jgi:hypothetical protein
VVQGEFQFGEADHGDGRKKDFFLEKRRRPPGGKQKTFATLQALCGNSNPLIDRSFLLLFFKKERLPSLFHHVI